METVVSEQSAAPPQEEAAAGMATAAQEEEGQEQDQHKAGAEGEEGGDASSAAAAQKGPVEFEPPTVRALCWASGRRWHTVAHPFIFYVPTPHYSRACTRSSSGRWASRCKWARRPRSGRMIVLSLALLPNVLHGWGGLPLWCGSPSTYKHTGDLYPRRRHLHPLPHCLVRVHTNTHLPLASPTPIFHSPFRPPHIAWTAPTTCAGRGGGRPSRPTTCTRRCGSWTWRTSWPPSRPSSPVSGGPVNGRGRPLGEGGWGGVDNDLIFQ